MSLKQKTIRGLSWAFADSFIGLIFQFVFGIILARILTPKEYGLVGMLAIFLAISDSFTLGGFGEALIRKQNVTRRDYSTVFIFNFLVSIACYLILLLLAGDISRFFQEPQLEEIIEVLCLTIIINGLGVVPRVFLVKKIDFKTIAKISVLGKGLSGVIAITLAFTGYGVWSLVWRSLSNSLIKTSLFFMWSHVPVQLKFSMNSFWELFGFGSKLLASRILDDLYRNVYYFVIGKFFSARELGLYTRADGYKNLGSGAINHVVATVSYPVLSEIKDDKVRLKRGYKKIIKTLMYLTFIVMFGLAAVAENFIIGLIGLKWKDAVPYLQLLCFVGVFYPIYSLNLNIMKVQGRSGLFLTLEVFRKVIEVPVILIGIFWGIKTMIVGMVVTSTVGYLVNAYYSGKLISYSVKEQLIDIFPCFLIGIVFGLISFLIGKSLFFSPLINLIIQCSIGMVAVIILSVLFKLQSFYNILDIIGSRVSRKKE